METKTICVRVSAKVAAVIDSLAREFNMTQSDVLKEGVSALQARLRETRSSYELGEDLFGRHGSGRRDASTRRKHLFRERVRAKHAGR